MSLSMDRVAVVSSNATNLGSLLNVAEEQNLLQSCMSLEAVQECLAGDTNKTRVKILCGKMIHELLEEKTTIFDALCNFFLERSEAYKCMYLRFTGLGSTHSGSGSMDAKSELFLLQEKVKCLTQDLLHVRQSLTSIECHPESIPAAELLPSSEDPALFYAIELENLEKDTADELAQVSPHPVDIKPILKEEAEETNEPKNENTHEHAEDHSDSAGETPYLCQDCGKSFRWKSQLMVHARGHTGERPYVCENCGMRFLMKSHLVRHSRAHTGEKPFACENCGQRFADKRNLVKHTAHAHIESETPPQCEHCGKQFKWKCQLIQHARIHTSERSFICEYCGMKFGLRSHLLRHSRAHTGEKPFGCEECGKRFADKRNLVKHARAHALEKHSDAAFPRDSTLLDIMSATHAAVLELEAGHADSTGRDSPTL